MLPEAPVAGRVATCGACRHPIDDHAMQPAGEIRGWITCAACESGDGDGPCGARTVAEWRSF